MLRTDYIWAINCYSRANNIKPGDPIILGNRSTAYSRVSHFLKQRPASTSEYRPLNGLDPTIHAELASKDVDKLEKYELAQDIILSGLQVDPFRSGESWKEIIRWEWLSLILLQAR